MKQAIEKTKYHIFEKTRPQVASKIAANLWFTPPKYEAALPEKMFLESAAIERVPCGETRHQSTINSFYTVYSWGRGPLVLLVHGWGGSTAQMCPLAKQLVEAGYQVIAFDAFAHGDSPGHKTDILEMKDIVLDILNRFEQVDAIVGHSLGGFAALLANQECEKADMLVTVNMAASLDYYYKQFTNYLHVVRTMSGRIAVRIGGCLGKNITDFSLMQIAPSVNYPHLIVHDQNDEMVSFQEAQALNQFWQNSELLITAGLGHSGFLHDVGTSEKIIQYLKKKQTYISEFVSYQS